MGLNAFFAYSVVGAMGYPWQTALGAVFISGVLFVILSVAGARQAIVKAIPLSLKFAITAGIGAFLAFLGFKSAGIVVANEATLVGLGSLTAPDRVAGDRRTDRHRRADVQEGQGRDPVRHRRHLADRHHHPDPGLLRGGRRPSVRSPASPTASSVCRSGPPT